MLVPWNKFSLCHTPIILVLAFLYSLSILLWVVRLHDHEVHIIYGFCNLFLDNYNNMNFSENYEHYIFLFINTFWWLWEFDMRIGNCFKKFLVIVCTTLPSSLNKHELHVKATYNTCLHICVINSSYTIIHEKQ